MRKSNRQFFSAMKSAYNNFPCPVEGCESCLCADACDFFEKAIEEYASRLSHKVNYDPDDYGFDNPNN